MTKPTDPASPEVPLNALPPMSLEKFIEQTGLSRSTIYRYESRGWLQTIVIAGRKYITRQAIADFNLRAGQGEFKGILANPYARNMENISRRVQ